MSPEESSAFVTEPAPSLLALSESDRDRLSEALQELLSSGSINGLEPSLAALYHWARQHDDWLREIAAINGLDVAIHHEERLIQAIPRVAPLRLRLTQDATLVWLALWFAGDVRWRDEGADHAALTRDDDEVAGADDRGVRTEGFAHRTDITPGRGGEIRAATIGDLAWRTSSSSGVPANFCAWK